MAHKLLLSEIPDAPSKWTKWPKLPSIEGKFGIALYIGGKEIFIGIAVNRVEVEHIIKRRFLPLAKATVKTFKFDPLN